MDSYQTINGSSQGEYEEKKSRFIAYLSHVEAEEEALAFITDVKARHPMARHHVYAYALRAENRVRYSDDGEPQKTAGLPTLSVLQHAELVDVACVVVRYFGGTLLGTGGLVRAYTKATQNAVVLARTASFAPCCDVVICVNKVDLCRLERLPEIYAKTGFHVLPVSAETGEGIEDLRRILSGKLCAFTGDSGVGKSSILNALNPAFSLRVGEVSDKLGRGRHTTRHVELFDLGEGTYLIDTPGFASFDMEAVEPVRCGQLQYDFPEFEPFLGQCRFQDCAHLKEPDCAVRAAVERGEIHPKRYQSYRLMYADASKYKEWELKN